MTHMSNTRQDQEQRVYRLALLNIPQSDYHDFHELLKPEVKYYTMAITNLEVLYHLHMFHYD